MEEESQAGRLRRRLSDGPLAGLFVKLPGLETVECAKLAGFDFAVVDLEHSALDERTTLDQVAYGRAIGLPMLIRLAAVDRPLIGRLLDAGAAGIQLSDVTSSTQVERLLAATRFPPAGERGVANSVRVGDYGQVSVSEHVRSSPDPICVIQVERGETADPLAELLDPRLDVCFVGAVDLSADLGVPGALESPEVRARIAEIAAGAREAGLALGGHGMTREGDPPTRFRTLGTDVTALLGRLTEMRSRELGGK